MFLLIQLKKTLLIITYSQDFRIFMKCQKSKVPTLLSNFNFIHAFLSLFWHMTIPSSLTSVLFATLKLRKELTVSKRAVGWLKFSFK